MWRIPATPPEFLGVCRGESQRCQKNAGLVSPSRMTQAEHIIAELHDIHNRVLGIGQMHGETMIALYLLARLLFTVILAKVSPYFLVGLGLREATYA